jgi:hypothetical protein
VIDPGTGYGNEKYEASYMLKMQTSEPSNSGASSGAYAAGSIMDAWANRTVTAIGPMNGRYDPELAAVFGEEI